MYKPNARTILLFKECYALEKIHGTSAHISWNKSLHFSSGSESHVNFVTLFNADDISKKLIDMGYMNRSVTIYGEAYGGKQQGMSHTYGTKLKFIAFDVCIDEGNWLNVPDAAAFCNALGIEFVHYVRISTDLKEIDAQRDEPSVQAIRNGITESKKREGVVLRPLIELTTSTGQRIISKHKGDEFRETASPRVVDDPAKLQVLADADKVAFEWVTVTRLEHVLDKIPGHSMAKMKDIIIAMTEDILREGKGELIESDTVKKAINKKTVEIYKNYTKK